MSTTFGAIILKLWAVLCVCASALSGFVARPFALWKGQFGLNEKRAICVVGGGFAGLYTALELCRREPNANVYLIDPKENFVFSPLLYELAVGTAAQVEVSPSYSTLLEGTNVKHIKGLFVGLHQDSKECIVRTNDKGDIMLAFHALVIALGIEPRIDMVPGAKTHSIPFYSATGALQLRSKLKIFKRDRRKGLVNVVVLGAGYGGVEVACNVAEYLGKRKAKVTIVDRNSKIMAPSVDFNRRTAERALASKGITTLLHTTVKCVKQDSVEVLNIARDTNTTLPADIVLFTAGTEPSPVVKALPLKKDEHGRLLTRKTLQCLDVPFIFALGDCATVACAHNPATAQVAMQQAPVAAHNILTYLAQQDGIEGQKMKDFSFTSLGEMLSLGDTNATISSLGGWVNLSGPLAAVGRRAVYGVRMPTFTQTVTALISAGAVTTGRLIGSMFSE